MSTGDVQLFDALARLVCYPTSSYWESLTACRDLIAQHGEAASGLVASFVSYAEGCELAELEEQFTRTFDISPQVSLEVGWHVFGEQYERGTFMVYMRGQMRALDLPESAELPDHLQHVLQVVGRQGPEAAGELVREMLRPALDKMLAALEGQENPFEPLLKAIHIVVTERYPGGPREMPIMASPRGGSIRVPRMGNL